MITDHQKCHNEVQVQNLCAMYLVTQSCLTLGDPVDCSPTGSSAHVDVIAEPKNKQTNKQDNANSN